MSYDLNSVSRPYKIEYAFATCPPCRSGMVPIKGTCGCVAAGRSAPPPPPAPPKPGLLDQLVSGGKKLLTPAADKAKTAVTDTVKTVANDQSQELFKQADARINRLENIANKGIGESNEWQGMVNNIMNQLKSNLPMVAVIGGAILLIFLLKR